MNHLCDHYSRICSCGFHCCFCKELDEEVDDEGNEFWICPRCGQANEKPFNRARGVKGCGHNGPVTISLVKGGIAYDAIFYN